MQNIPKTVDGVVLESRCLLYLRRLGENNDDSNKYVWGCGYAPSYDIIVEFVCLLRASHCSSCIDDFVAI